MRASLVAALFTAHVRLSRIPVSAAFSGASSPDPPRSSSAADSYVSRSTANPDASAPFYSGSDDRRARLDAALSDIGLEASVITDSPEFRGSAALRMYTSFILPKSEGALASAQAPQRASVIANSIAFMVREHRSHQEEWLCNHDRSLEEVRSLEGPAHPLTIILDNVRSAHNVGNILRAAEAGRLEKVYLCGMTPAPPNKKVLKTALGAAEYVNYEQMGSTLELVRNLKERGVVVWGVETTSKSRPLWKVVMPKPVALIFGNELVGVDTEVLKLCDGIVSVPTYGLKNSLNVATCASVLIWEALRQWEVEPENGTEGN
uniref:tRNA/rRNA methyltransferase SpoU type domain-containing protein n=1 Tax=Odontella aurita TaxID=265563 RepID=A0A7S4MU98_9STRA